MMQSLTQDLRFALRLVRQRPGFTLMAVLILALGLGANTAIFSVVNALLLRPLPFRQPERLVSLFERQVVGTEANVSVAPGNFLDWQRLATSFEHMSAYTMEAANLSSATSSFEPQRVDICSCSGNLFSTLGVMPMLGRAFRPDEERHGAPHVAVIGYNLWQQHFGGAPDTVGRQIQLDAQSFEIIGVMPRGFLFPYRTVDVWIPLFAYLSPATQMRHDLHFLRVIARLRPGVSLDKARAEVDGLAARYKNAHRDEATGKGANASLLHDDLVHDVRTSLVILLGAVGCVLLIACVNIANLLLTRAAGRTRELCVRAAIGASRGRLIRQLLTESILLSLAGGTAGLMLAFWVNGLLVSHAPGAAAILPSGDVPVDPNVFLFTFGVALLTGFAAGLYPALQSSSGDLANGLKESSRFSTHGRAHGRFRNILVTAEVALSLVLLVAAGLLLRSFSRLYQVNPGVRVDHTLTMAFSLPSESYKGAAQNSAFFTRLQERMQELPGVRSVGITSCAPVTGECNTLFFYVEGRPVVHGQVLAALERSVTPEYFAAAGIPLVRGRVFTRRDGLGFDEKHPRPGSVIISDSMAKTFFPNEDPLGKRIFFDYAVEQAKIQGSPVPHYEVIGIVGDVLPALDQRVSPTLYLPLLDGAYSGGSVLVHTAVEPRSLVNAAEKEIRKLDPGLAIFDVQTMEEILGRSASDRQFSMLLFGA